MKKIDKNNEGQLLLMIGVILTFTLITMASISVSIADIGLRTSSEQIQQLLHEFDNINTTFWRAYETEHYKIALERQNAPKMIEKSDIELIFNETVTRINDMVELRGMRFAAIGNVNIKPPSIRTSTTVLEIPQSNTSYGVIFSGGIRWITQDLVLDNVQHSLYQSAVATNQGTFYLIGGRNDNTVCSDVYYSTQAAGGSLNDWKSTTSLPSPRTWHAAVTDKTNSRVYVLGGFYGAVPQRTVYYANLALTGIEGNWTETLPFNTSLHKHSAVIYGNRIYVIGGEDGTYQAVSTVYSCEIATNGSINSWRNESPIPARKSHSATICVVGSDPYIYVTGGIDSNGMVTNTVYYTKINIGNGTLDQWSLSPTTLPEPVYSHGSTVDGNRLYLIGGRSATTSNRVIFTKISDGGDIDVNGWSNTTSLSNAPAEASCWSFNGVIYVTGGLDNWGVTNPSSDEFYAGSTIDYKFTLNDEKSTIKFSSSHTSSAI